MVRPRGEKEEEEGTEKKEERRHNCSFVPAPLVLPPLFEAGVTFFPTS